MQWIELHFESPSEKSFSSRRSLCNQFAGVSSPRTCFTAARFLESDPLTRISIGSPQRRPKQARSNVVTISHLRTMDARTMACRGSRKPQGFCLFFLALSVRYCSRSWSKLTTTRDRGDPRVQQEGNPGFVQPRLPVPDPACFQGWFGAGPGWLLAGVEDRGAGGLFRGVVGNL